jgi:hypothetical protein
MEDWVMKKRERNRNVRKPMQSDRCTDFLGAMLNTTAPTIEAAGNFDRALRLGLIGGPPEMIDMLRDVVPISRGGNLAHPEAEHDWAELVAACVRDRGLDLEVLRKQFQGLEKGQDTKAG